MYAGELSNLRYAVIEAKWIERPAERFAVGYYSEESLRELIVGSNIVGSGFVSRQEALGLIPESLKVAPNAARTSETACESNESRSSAYPETAELENQFPQGNLKIILSRLLHQAAAAFVLIACSKNVFSMTIRAFMGI